MIPTKKVKGKPVDIQLKELREQKRLYLPLATYVVVEKMSSCIIPMRKCSM